MAVFAVMGVLGLFGSTQMVKGFPITDVFEYDSYVSKFLISQSEQFPDQAYPFCPPRPKPPHSRGRVFHSESHSESVSHSESSESGLRGCGGA
jgi:hypothetical protein